MLLDSDKILKKKTKLRFLLFRGLLGYFSPAGFYFENIFWGEGGLVVIPSLPRVPTVLFVILVFLL
jgi:hypothetical protein